MFFDPVYILFIAPGFFVGLLATILLKFWGNKYKNVQNVNHLSGVELAGKISSLYKLDFNLIIYGDTYSDNYNPTDKSLTLSRDVAYGTTITSLAITAHELGHAIQHKQGSILITIRSFLIPAVNIGTNLGYLLIVLGFIINFLQLSQAGIILFSLSTVFTLLTLPIEIDASNRAIKFLNTSEILFPDEVSGAKKILTAAALTYVAALFESVGQIFYFIFRIRKSN